MTRQLCLHICELLIECSLNAESRQSRLTYRRFATEAPNNQNHRSKS